jgi:hypothetical protein
MSPLALQMNRGASAGDDQSLDGRKSWRRRSLCRRTVASPRSTSDFRPIRSCSDSGARMSPESPHWTSVRRREARPSSIERDLDPTRNDYRPSSNRGSHPSFPQRPRGQTVSSRPPWFCPPHDRIPLIRNLIARWYCVVLRQLLIKLSAQVLSPSGHFREARYALEVQPCEQNRTSSFVACNLKAEQTSHVPNEWPRANGLAL